MTKLVWLNERKSKEQALNGLDGRHVPCGFCVILLLVFPGAQIDFVKLGFHVSSYNKDHNNTAIAYIPHDTIDLNA